MASSGRRAAGVRVCGVVVWWLQWGSEQSGSGQSGREQSGGGRVATVGTAHLASAGAAPLLQQRLGDLGVGDAGHADGLLEDGLALRLLLRRQLPGDGVLDEEARPVKLDRDLSLQRVDEPLRLAQVRLGLPRVSVRSVSIPNTKILVLATDSATSAHADQLVLTLQQLPLRGLCTAGQSAQKW